MWSELHVGKNNAESLQISWTTLELELSEPIACKADKESDKITALKGGLCSNHYKALRIANNSAINTEESFEIL